MPAKPMKPNKPNKNLTNLTAGIYFQSVYERQSIYNNIQFKGQIKPLISRVSKSVHMLYPVNTNT